MGLPYGYSKCSRGGAGRPPTCTQWFSIQNHEAPRPSEQTSAPGAPATNASAQAVAAPPRLGLAAAFGQYSRTLADAVHSGSGRTASADNNTDYYPVALKEETLRPGTAYHDPYGHVLMIVRRMAQTDGSAGIILAVDGQPDGTVARKRFWRGNFLYAQDPALGGPGFKRFRPIALDRNGVLRRLSNDEIAKNPQYADFSLEPSRMGSKTFTIAWMT